MKTIELQLNESTLETIFLIILFGLFVFFMYSASKTDYLGEDESTYFRMTVEMFRGNYTGFTWNGQPITAPLLLSFLSSILFHVFGIKLAVLKIVSCIFGFFAVVMLYFAVEKIKGIASAILASTLLLSFLYFSHFLMLAYVEVMVAFFSSLVIFILTREKNIKYAVILGFVVALSFFSKQSALLFFPILLSYMIWAKFGWKYIGVSMVIPLAIIGLFVLYNISVYKIPAVFMFNDVWYIIHGNPYPSTTLPEFEAVGKIFVVDLISSIGFWQMAFIFIGFFYAYHKQEDDKITKLPFFAIAFFLVMSAFLKFSHEVRYLAIIYPFMAFLTIGYWKELGEVIENTTKRRWVFFIVLSVLVTYFLYNSITTVQSTSSQHRWEQTYIDGLYWIRDNTPQNSTVFTAYGGSVYYYAQRNYTWVTSKFPEIMRSNDTATIFNDLITQKADYIYVWRGIIGNDYVLPQSNLYGIFTYNFLNNINQDTIHFTKVFGNDMGEIYEVVKNQTQFNISES